MRIRSLFIKICAFVAAAAISVVVANYSVRLIETRSEIGVRAALDTAGLTWAEVEADGLQVKLTGTGPTEAIRFQALSAAGTIVDSARVIDAMQVEAQAQIAPPRFSAEILRNDAGISVIGLIPQATDRADLTKRFERVAGAQDVADFLETADYPVPDGWDDALSFSIRALQELPRTKISVQAGLVRVTALAESPEEKTRIERVLQRATPPVLKTVLTIDAPRPVLTPFTLRFVSDVDGARFDACSADTEVARDRILDAAVQAGLTTPTACTIGLGVPTPKWADAVEMGLAAVTELGGGSLTFSDADVALRALEGTGQDVFDRVIGDLENALPGVFALTAVLPKPDTPNDGPAEFVATLSPEGQVQLRGRMGDEGSRALATSFAKSLFGSGQVYAAPRLADGLPANWSTRVLTGLEALGNLSNGALVVTPDVIEISGNTGSAQANTRIAQLFASKLGEAANFNIRVTYQEQLDPVAALPTPQECEMRIKAITEISKISFEPGSATIDAAALGTMDRIAEVLKECGDLELEIQGHTDSQGREVMNLELSQSRAESVLNELRARRVLTRGFIAQGYGETAPIADNGTEEGREDNRRIEFVLIRPEPVDPNEESALDSLAGQVAPVEDDSAAEGDDNEQN